VNLTGVKRVRCVDFSRVTSLSDTPKWCKPEVREKLVVDVEQGKLVLFALSPSAGAQLAVLCDDVKFERRTSHLCGPKHGGRDAFAAFCNRQVSSNTELQSINKEWSVCCLPRFVPK